MALVESVGLFEGRNIVEEGIVVDKRVMNEDDMVVIGKISVSDGRLAIEEDTGTGKVVVGEGKTVVEEGVAVCDERVMIEVDVVHGSIGVYRGLPEEEMVVEPEVRLTKVVVDVWVPRGSVAPVMKGKGLIVSVSIE